MKRLGISIMLISMFLLSTAAVAALAQGGVSSSIAPRRIDLRSPATCNLDITTPSSDLYFVGKARRECVEKNKFNFLCQRNCFDKVTAFVRGSAGTQQGGVYSRIGCNEIDATMLSGTMSSRCYYVASLECEKANPSSDYCRRKCMQGVYAMCRRATQSRQPVGMSMGMMGGGVMGPYPATPSGAPHTTAGTYRTT